MTRTANVFARVEPEVKERAEQIMTAIRKLDTMPNRN